MEVASLLSKFIWCKHTSLRPLLGLSYASLLVTRLDIRFQISLNGYCLCSKLHRSGQGNNRLDHCVILILSFRERSHNFL